MAEITDEAVVAAGLAYVRCPLTSRAEKMRAALLAALPLLGTRAWAVKDESVSGLAYVSLLEMEAITTASEHDAVVPVRIIEEPGHEG